MREKSLPTEQIMNMLREASPRIKAATASLPPDQLCAAPNPGEWSANEVLAHLRACADQWGGCIVAMIEQDRPTLRAINPRTWIKQTNYLEQEFKPSLRAFARQRAELLALLEPLAPEEWSRSATVTGAGAPLVRTVHFYAQWLATHEHRHLEQIERIAGAMGGIGYGK